MGLRPREYPNQPFFIRGIEAALPGLVLGLAMLRFGILAPLVAHYSIDAFYSALLFLHSDNAWLAAAGALTAGLYLVPLLVATCAYLASGRFHPEENLLNAAQGSAPMRPVEPARRHPALPRYAPLSRPAAAAALALLGAGLLALALGPSRTGGFLNFKTSAAGAARSAAEFLRGEGFDVAAFRRATQPIERIDAVAVQYLYTTAGLPALERVYSAGRLAPAAVWQTRFFKPLDKAE